MKNSIETLKKLALNKETIVQLDKPSMKSVKGGSDDPVGGSTAGNCGSTRTTVRTVKTR
ncbi:class I lanthipeptide [Rhodocytophaga aerolata]|uniref:Class I lanthipeptide n=1 Tax=Rhodocytophaga aerolata TaxID=455078 RepID=A0ABT8RJ53_9BACT|nr:class I lanthipeptide [Rhodocytophaga aerolata]MDO1450747.1 class I lanthipeptide [Rhodocytophaga aerolata]